VRTLKGRCALVTGGARRLGRATAVSLAESGSDVIVHYYRSQTDALEVAEEIRAIGRRCETVRADVRDDCDLSALLDSAARKLRQPDILVNNASIFPVCDFESATLDDLMDNVRANAWGPFALARGFADALDGHGSVVNIIDSRVAGYDWQHVPYHLSKSLLAVMTRVLAVKLAPKVTVNGVAPGLILPPEGKDQGYLESLKDRSPMRKIGSVADVTDAVVYLAGCAFVTGQIIFVDGGRNLLRE